MNRPTSYGLDRRTALRRIAACSAVAATAPIQSGFAAVSVPKTGLGLVAYCCGIRRKSLARQDPASDLFEPLTFLRHCHSLGAGGMQVSLGSLAADRVQALRQFAEQNGLFIDGIVNPPQDGADISRFDAEIRTAADVGALAVRTVVMPGRRYEQFRSLAEVRDAEARARKMLELAAPIVTKHRVRLAVENHKDQRIDERIGLHKHLSCEFIGATVDTGNSFALLDDPYGAIEALGPYAFTVHLKDQAVRAYDDGFLLGDIPLGQGCFDLKRMVEILRKAQPKVRFLLELITRDPLKVACLTESYWATMPTVPGGDLARTLKIVHAHRSENLQQVSLLSPAQQVELEDANIAASLQYARETLGL
jgi:sugar phosphate isomerase/epimerase